MNFCVSEISIYVKKKTSFKLNVFTLIYSIFSQKCVLFNFHNNNITFRCKFKINMDDQ